MTQPRRNINIELADGAREQLEEVRSYNGMTQKEMVGRLVNWFCTQDRVLQQAILGQIPEEIAPDMAKVVLERIAKGEWTSGRAAMSGGRPPSVSRDQLVGEIPSSKK